MSEGILIALDGIDGAGKTTQAKLLADALTAAGEIVVLSKEPTDGQWGQKLKDSATSGRLPLDIELDYFIRDRREHVAQVIRPALDRGELVILDRYYFSTIAYQGARGADREAVWQEMRGFAPEPDAAFIIDVEPVVGLERISISRGETPNHFEKREPLQRVRKIFRELAAASDKIALIDGHQSVEHVYQEIAHLLVAGVLKSKRCAKSYDCDSFFCSYRMTGECQWVADSKKLLA